MFDGWKIVCGCESGLRHGLLARIDPNQPRATEGVRGEMDDEGRPSHIEAGVLVVTVTRTEDIECLHPVPAVHHHVEDHACMLVRDGEHEGRSVGSCGRVLWIESGSDDTSRPQGEDDGFFLCPGVEDMHRAPVVRDFPIRFEGHGDLDLPTRAVHCHQRTRHFLLFSHLTPSQRFGVKHRV